MCGGLGAARFSLSAGLGSLSRSLLTQPPSRPVRRMVYTGSSSDFAKRNPIAAAGFGTEAEMAELLFWKRDSDQRLLLRASEMEPVLGAAKSAETILIEGQP